MIYLSTVCFFTFNSYFFVKILPRILAQECNDLYLCDFLFMLHLPVMHLQCKLGDVCTLYIFVQCIFLYLIYKYKLYTVIDFT